MKRRTKEDLIGSRHRQRAANTVLGLDSLQRTGSAVTSLPVTGGGESLAAVLKVTLVLHFPPHGGVPVVLDGVVCAVRENSVGIKVQPDFPAGRRNVHVGRGVTLPARKKLRDLCPAVAEPFVCFIDNSILLLSPGGLLHLWVQVVVPTLTALFPNPPLQVFCYYRPTLRAILVHQIDHLHNTPKTGNSLETNFLPFFFFTEKDRKCN